MCVCEAIVFLNYPLMKKIFTIILILQSNVIFSQTTLYVNQNVQGGLENGTNWLDAFPDLQDALLVASNGDKIWVAKGTYFPTSTSDRSISFAVGGACPSPV